MDRGIIFWFLIAALITVSVAEDKQSLSISEEVNANEFRNARVSSEFGYNVQNSDRESSHFRQEHRDVNGVVRGSYGFKNPNGAFRLVQYVADDKGFRAHVSSNEQGVGRQNPASVSINRFEHQQVANEDKTSFKPPISALRRQNFRLGSYTPEAQRQGFYSPLETRTNSRNNGNPNLDISFLDDNNSYRYDERRQEFQSNVRQNPVEKLIKTRFNVPGEIISTLRQNERDDIKHPIWATGPYYAVPSKHPLVQDGANRDFINPLYDTEILPHNSYHDTKTKENFKRPISNHPQFLSNLLHRPQHKVHTSLPDCNSVSSAVLCKPPMFLSGKISQQNNSRHDEIFPLDEVLRTSESQMVLPEEKSQNLDSSSSSKFYELTNAGDKMMPPHLMPNSYPLRSDIYNNFFNYLNEHGKSVKQDKECLKHIFPSEFIPKDYFAHLESQKIINDASRTDFMTHNFNRQDTSFSKNLEDNVSKQHSNSRDEEFYSSLIRIIQNDESLNKLKHLILQTHQSSIDSIPAVKSPNLSLLGVLILPSHIVKRLNYNQVRMPEINKASNLDEKNLSQFGDDIFESDIVDETQQYLEEHNENFPETNFDKSTNFKEDSTLEDTNSSENKTNKLEFDDSPLYHPTMLKNPLHTSQYSLNQTETSHESMKNSKFHILDDQELSNKNRNKLVKESDRNSNFSSNNWRKILEDEMNKEMRGASLHQETPPSEILPEVLKITTHPTDDIHPNVHPYSLNKHIGPLYDSTGKLIQPENVPIHIHRFNPPSGLTSLPWKYSIPRPAPPRSIVVPPKPHIL